MNLYLKLKKWEKVLFVEMILSLSSFDSIFVILKDEF